MLDLLQGYHRILFHYRGDNERVGTVTRKDNTVEEAEKETNT